MKLWQYGALFVGGVGMGVVGTKAIMMLSEMRFPREVACATGAIGVALLLHELGHAAVGWLRGLGPRELILGFGPEIARMGSVSFRLLPLGAAVRFADPSAPGCVAMLLAGPATNLLLALACCCWLVPSGQRLVAMQEALVDLVTMPWVSNVGLVHAIATATSHPPLLVHFGGLNLSMAALNLLPLWPLDGGRILCRFLPASQCERAQLTGAITVLGGALFLVLRDCYRLALNKAG